jgi:hypothetical protein
LWRSMLALSCAASFALLLFSVATYIPFDRTSCDCSSFGVRPRRYGDPTTVCRSSTTGVEKCLQAEVGTALVELGKFIRTSVRKVTGGTDNFEACRGG